MPKINPEISPRRDAGANLTSPRGSSRPGSITQTGRDINQPLTYAERMSGVETTTGRQGSGNGADYAPHGRDENRGGFGVTDTAQRPGGRDQAIADHGQVGAAPRRDDRYHIPAKQADAQPGQSDAHIDDRHGERSGHGTQEGKAEKGRGHDERGSYGKGAAS